jgi:hypothetical protein
MGFSDIISDKIVEIVEEVIEYHQGIINDERRCDLIKIIANLLQFRDKYDHIRPYQPPPVQEFLLEAENILDEILKEYFLIYPNS